MSYSVYKIDTYPAGCNAYGVDRDENWIVRFDKHFDTDAEAREYIRQKTKMCSTLPNLLIDLKTEEEKQAFTDEFCFHNNRYLAHRRHFLGTPPIKDIKLALQHDGIDVRDAPAVG